MKRNNPDRISYRITEWDGVIIVGDSRRKRKNSKRIKYLSRSLEKKKEERIDI